MFRFTYVHRRGTYVASWHRKHAQIIDSSHCHFSAINVPELEMVIWIVETVVVLLGLVLKQTAISQINLS